jgi:hypothetical protein
MLERLLAQRDALVRAITSAASTQEWEAVMGAFDGLLAALKELEASLEAACPDGAPGPVGMLDQGTTDS